MNKTNRYLFTLNQDSKPVWHTFVSLLRTSCFLSPSLLERGPLCSNYPFSGQKSNSFEESNFRQSKQRFSMLIACNLLHIAKILSVLMSRFFLIVQELALIASLLQLRMIQPMLRSSLHFLLFITSITIPSCIKCMYKGWRKKRQSIYFDIF